MTDYKLDSDFELIGSFWYANNPDNKFTGTVTSKAGIVEVVASPVYEPNYIDGLQRGMQRLLGSDLLTPVGTIALSF